MGFESPIITGVSAIALDALSPGFFSTYREISTGVSTAFSCLVEHILYHFLLSNEFKYNTVQAICTVVTATGICYLIPQIDLRQMPVLFLFGAASTFLGSYLCKTLDIEKSLGVVDETSPPDTPAQPTS